jgi:hypothetical protein
MRDYIGQYGSEPIDASTLLVSRDHAILHRSAIKELETAINQFLADSDLGEVQEKKSQIDHEILAGVLTSMQRLRPCGESEVPLQHIADLRSSLLKVALLRWNRPNSDAGC